MQLDPEPNVCSLETQMSMLRHKEAWRDGAWNAVIKILPTARVKRATLRRDRDKVPSRLKTLETDPGKSSKVVSERTTGGSWLMSKKFGTEGAQGL